MNAETFAEVFSLLPPTENPKRTTVNGVPYILHRDHRWLLPIAFVAQARGLLPKPCTIVMFDWHHDALNPLRIASNELKRLRAEPTVEGIASLCQDNLKKNDDDWLKAGMDLDLFGDAVIFGVDDKSMEDELRFYDDHAGNKHEINMCALPKTALSYQGRLIDLVRYEELGSMWKTLGWEVGGSSGQFVDGLPKVLLTIDLDCFAIPWRDYVFPWPDSVFQSEFHEPVGHCWTGESFLRELASKAGIVSIAMEPGCCGGQENAQTILEKLIHYGFNGGFSF